MSAQQLSQFTFDNLTNIDVSLLCEANYASLKNIIQTAPEAVRNEHPRLPRAVYKLLGIVFSLRERAQKENSPQGEIENGNTSNGANALESLLSLTPDDMEKLANDNLSELKSMVDSALRADPSLTPREYGEADTSSIMRLVLRWQLQATKAALERRDLGIATLQPGTPAQLQDDPPPTPKRFNPLDLQDVSDLSRKRQNVLRIPGVPTGEQEDEAQDFRLGFGGSAQIRPSQLGQYPGKTSVLLNVQELMAHVFILPARPQHRDCCKNHKMATTSGRQALQLRGRSSYTGKVSSLSSLSIQHDGRSYRHVSLDGNCSEKIMGPFESPKSYFATESSDARRSLATSATFSRSLPRRRNSSASDAYSGEPSDLRRLPDTECRKEPREKKPDTFQQSKCKEREAGIATTPDPERRRTFPITHVFKENSSSTSLLSSALDFLYLGKQKPLETAAHLPLSTLKASKSIMSRYNDFESHSGQLFKTQISTCVNLPSIHQDAHRSLPTKTHDDKAAHDFTDELKQSGMIKGDFKLLEASRMDLPVSAHPPTTCS